MMDTNANIQNEDRRETFIARIQVSWESWLAAADVLPDDQLLQPDTCGPWSVKDLIGHVTTWDGVAVDKVQGIMAGAARPETSETVDAFNARTAHAFRHDSLDDLRQRMHVGHARLMEALDGTAMASDEAFGWIVWAIAEDTWQHYDEHRQQVADRFG